MLKAIKPFTARFFANITIIVLLIAGFFYLRADDRIESDVNIPPFVNAEVVWRMDSTTLTPDSIASFIEALTKEAKVHGLAISIVNNNKLVYQRYFGNKDHEKNEPFRPGTVFQAASFSKTLLADVVLQLADEGILHLDTPLYKYLDRPLYRYRTTSIEEFFDVAPIDYSDLESDDRHTKITARMCLAHTTGFPNWRHLENDRKLKIRFPPGTRYFYSGEGMYLLQFVLEQLTGKTYEELATERIFIPMKMSRSSYVWQRSYEDLYATAHDGSGKRVRTPKRKYANAAASLSTSLEDYTRYFMEVLRQNEPCYRELITRQVSITSKQQFGPNALVETNENDAIRLGYGLGFGIYETPWGTAFFKEGHNDGWQHYAVGFPSNGTALIIMSNSNNAESTFKHLIEFCLANPYTPWFWEGYIPFDQTSTVHVQRQ